MSNFLRPVVYRIFEGFKIVKSQKQCPNHYKCNIKGDIKVLKFWDLFA